jgi:GNAT superfamily N-acetyltransferase
MIGLWSFVLRLYGVVMAEFIFRDALPEDREEIMALADAASEGGDYVHWVFERWVSDPGGRFLAVVDAESGRIAAIDKLTMLSPREGWFEGLRVHPDFRGRGLYTQIERHMIREARRLGARVIRFLTRTDNYPVHRNAFRHGFDMRLVVRGWTWSSPDETSSKSPLTEQSETVPLRPASQDEASILYGWWKRTEPGHATGGLLNRGWSFSETSPEEWEARAASGELLLPEPIVVGEASLPPPFVLLSEIVYDGASGPEWEIATVGGTGGDVGALLLSVTNEALQRGISEISAVLPDSYELHSAMVRAGFGRVEGYGAMALFELSFDL